MSEEAAKNNGSELNADKMMIIARVLDLGRIISKIADDARRGPARYTVTREISASEMATLKENGITVESLRQSKLFTPIQTTSGEVITYNHCRVSGCSFK